MGSIKDIIGINDQLFNLLDDIYEDEFIDQETGEILLDKANDKLNELDLTRKDKLEGLGLYIRRLKNLAEEIKSEKAIYAQRQKTLENKIDYLSNFIINNLLIFGDKNFETSKIKMAYRKSQVLNIDNKQVDKIPTNLSDRFIKEKTEYTVNIKELKEAISNNEVNIDGINIIDNYSLQIK